VSQATDAFKVAVANVADLLDRQIALMVDEKFNNGLTSNPISSDLDPADAGLYQAGRAAHAAGARHNPRREPCSE